MQSETLAQSQNSNRGDEVRARVNCRRLFLGIGREGGECSGPEACIPLSWEDIGDLRCTRFLHQKTVITDARQRFFTAALNVSW